MFLNSWDVPGAMENVWNEDLIFTKPPLTCDTGVPLTGQHLHLRLAELKKNTTRCRGRVLLQLRQPEMKMLARERYTRVAGAGTAPRRMLFKRTSLANIRPIRTISGSPDMEHMPKAGLSGPYMVHSEGPFLRCNP